MKYRVILPALLLALGAARPASAQCCGYGMSYDNVVVWPQPDLRVPVPSVTEAKKAKPVLAKAKPAVKENARKLSMHFPPAQRAQVEQYYVESMATYLKLEKKMGWAPRDMAGGLAAFLVGNYMVLKERNVSDEEYAAVASQLRAQQGMQKMGDNADQEKLRDVFEQSAMVGVFMAVAYMAHEQKPQPSAVYDNLRNAARENLQLVLKTDPARLNIDKNGMRFQ
ncbi:DUF6683 family protein [Pseudoduganella sp.]|uniref:DUF6683 family protein n=1 Tax=Pseudoduganella sp. TaxID=1880898 RepID=UPI0035B03DC8